MSAGKEQSLIPCGRVKFRIAGVNIIALLFVTCIVARLIRVNIIVYVVTFAVFVHLITLLVQKKNIESSRFSTGLFFAGLASLWVIIMTVFTPYELNSEGLFLSPLLMFAFFAIGVILAEVKPKSYITDGMRQMSNLVFILCVFGFILQYLFGLQFGTDTFWPTGDEPNPYKPFELVPLQNYTTARMSSVFNHPIVFADLAVFAFAFFLFAEEKGPITFLKMAVLVVALILTGTRGAWFGFALLVLVYGVKLSMAKRRLVEMLFVLVPILLIALTVLAFMGVLDPVTKRLMNLQVSVSFGQRFGAILYMVGILASNPVFALIGFGNGASSAAMLQTTIVLRDFNTVDNAWISVAFDYGLIIAVLVVFAVLRCVVFGLRSEDQMISFLGVGIVLMGAFDMCFYNMLSWYVPSSLFILTLGWMLEWSAIESRIRSTSRLFGVQFSEPVLTDFTSSIATILKQD